MNIQEFINRIFGGWFGASMSPGQIETANFQNKLNQENFEKYESIPAQVSQMKEVGLNPALMYGGASAGSGNIPDVSVPAATPAPGMDIMGQISAAVQSAQSVLGMNEQLEGLRLDNESKRLQNEATKFTNSTLPKLFELNVQQTQATIDNIKKSSDKIFEETRLSHELIAKAIAETENTESRTVLQDLQQVGQQYQNMCLKIQADHAEELTKLNIQLQQANKRLTEAQTSKTYADIEKSKNEILRINAEIGEIQYRSTYLLPAQKDQIEAATKSVKASTGLTEQQARYYATNLYFQWYTSSLDALSSARGTMAGGIKQATKYKQVEKFEDFIKNNLPSSR